MFDGHNDPYEHMTSVNMQMVIPTPYASKEDVMGYETERWCKFHIVKGCHTEDCYHLKKEIENLIQEGNLKKYMKGDPSNPIERHNPRGREGSISHESNKYKGTS